MTKFKKRYNVCGRNLLQLRKSLKLSQTDLARKVQLEGLSIDKKTISLIENEKWGFQDYEIICFAKAMNIPTYIFWMDRQKMRKKVKIKVKINCEEDIHCFC